VWSLIFDRWGVGRRDRAWAAGRIAPFNSSAGLSWSSSGMSRRLRRRVEDPQAAASLAFLALAVRPAARGRAPVSLCRCLQIDPVAPNPPNDTLHPPRAPEDPCHARGSLEAARCPASAPPPTFSVRPDTTLPRHAPDCLKFCWLLNFENFCIYIYIYIFFIIERQTDR
jgi:hypothetical protein